MTAHHLVFSSASSLTSWSTTASNSFPRTSFARITPLLSRTYTVGQPRTFHARLIGPIAPFAPFQNERTILHPLDEFAFVQNHLHARPAPTRPEHNRCYCSAIVAKLELNSVQVLTLNVGCNLSDPQVSQLIQFLFRFLSKSPLILQQPQAAGIVADDCLKRFFGFGCERICFGCFLLFGFGEFFSGLPRDGHHCLAARSLIGILFCHRLNQSNRYRVRCGL